MQNKPNFGNDKMNINTTVTMNYVILSHWLRPKNKPNSNPIKPKTNPIKANSNPIKANFEHSNFQIRSLQNAKAADWTLQQPKGNTKKSR